MTELRELDKTSTEPKTDGCGKDSDSDTIPELEEAAGCAAGPGGLPMDMVSKAKQSRGEKKARKIIPKLGNKPDEANMLSTITGSSTKQMTCLTIPPQKRDSETTLPFGRYNARKTAKRQHHYKTLEENTGQPSTVLVTNRPKRKSAGKLKLVVSKKHCLTVDSHDLQSLNRSDSDESFIAKSKSNCKKCTNQNNADRKCKISLVESDLESVSSTSNRYRELRNRNNVALRKSRLNRKSREVVMKAQAVQLEKDNRLLKIKAAILQKSMQIFQYEEPFINDVDSSCTFIIPDKLSSLIDTHQGDMITAEEVIVKPEETCVVTVEPIRQLVQPLANSLSTVFVKPEPTPVFKMTEETPIPAAVHTKLKLDIEAATMTSQTETMDTTEVVEPLVKGIDGFSLLSYVCDDKANMLSTTTGRSTNQMACLTIPPQKRDSETKMPLGRYNITKIAKRKRQYKSLEENIGQPSTLLVTNRPKRKSAENLKLVVSKKHRLTVDSDDLESLNSVDTSIISDSDELFSAKSNCKKCINKNNAGRKHKVSLSDSDLESREVEMKAQTVQLEKDNRLLKIKAAILQRLIQIFLSEEPFINDVDSCTFIPDKPSSPIDTHQDDMITAEEVVVKSKDTCVVTVEPIRQPTPVFKMTEETPKPAFVRPKLKLDIEAATMTSQTETMDTPEVVEPLVEGVGGFSLHSCVCDDEANMLSTITGSSTKQITCLTIPPQKRDFETTLPFGRYNASKTAKRQHHYKTLEENTGQPSTVLVTNRPKRKSIKNLKLVVSKKHRLTVDSDDLKSFNSVDTSIVSDSDESFSAKSKSNRKKRLNKNNAGRKRKVSLVDSDLESVRSTPNRYRDLRNRNNKASRKSRLNKKSREVELIAQVVQLEKYNRLLKLKADKMVRLVKKLRGSFTVKR